MIKKIICAGLIICIMLVAAQTAYAAVPRYGFGRGQQAIHINPQSVSNPASGFSINNAPQGIVNPTGVYVYNVRIGRLTVERLGRTVNIYSGATMWSMDRGVGHFPFSGQNHGNTSLVGHNRGWNGFFSFVRHLRVGDVITVSYLGGVTRKYAVQRVFTIQETDWTPLSQFGDNRLTMVTCVEYQRNLRRVAVAVEI